MISVPNLASAPQQSAPRGNDDLHLHRGQDVIILSSLLPGFAAASSPSSHIFCCKV
jgi:hypothetical protein